MTDLYQKLLLVQNIPKIQGVGGVQDLIKSFAYRGDMVMELAKEFEYHFRWVLHDIREFTQNLNIYLYNDNNIWTFYEKKSQKLTCILTRYRICNICGNYTYISDYNFLTTKYPRCRNPFFI